MAALDIFSRRGALRILWELRANAVFTFRGLSAAAELPPGTLNARLKDMREAGLIVTDGGYGLSPIGRELLVALEPLVKWSEQWAKDLAKP